ncbi:unnamed protein product [Lota lota]
MELLQGLNIMMGRAQKPTTIQCPDPASFAEQLNTFYTRFNRTDPVGDWTPNNISYAPRSNQCVGTKGCVHGLQATPEESSWTGQTQAPRRLRGVCRLEVAA